MKKTKRHWYRYTDAEVQSITADYKAGINAKVIAKKHQREPTAIRNLMTARGVRSGRLGPADWSGYDDRLRHLCFVRGLSRRVIAQLMDLPYHTTVRRIAYLRAEAARADSQERGDE